MALLRRFEAKTLVLFLGLSLLSCGANAIRQVNPPPENVVFDVTKFGAGSDGISDSAAAFMKTWKEACASKKNSTLLIPGGVYTSSEVKFHGPCANKMTLDVQGTVLADTNAHSYPDRVWFEFQSIDGLVIKGKGMFDAEERIVMDVYSCVANYCDRFIPSFIFRKVRNVNIDGMTSRNSKGDNIQIQESTNITFQNVHFFSHAGSRDFDAVAIQAYASVDIKVVSGYIETGGYCDRGSVVLDPASVICRQY